MTKVPTNLGVDPSRKRWGSEILNSWWHLRRRPVPRKHSTTPTLVRIIVLENQISKIIVIALIGMHLNWLRLRKWVNSTIRTIKSLLRRNQLRRATLKKWKRLCIKIERRTVFWLQTRRLQWCSISLSLQLVRKRMESNSGPIRPLVVNLTITIHNHNSTIDEAMRF